MLLTSMLFAIGLAIVLGSYLSLARTTLKLAHRTYFSNDATNLAEAGLDEALYRFNLMGSGTAAATAWTGWTISTTNAMFTLPTFNRDQNAIGIVKVYVHGYNGSDPAPYVLSQATITPFDGNAPIVKILQIKLGFKPENIPAAVAGISGLTFTGTAYADSFNSNPSGSPTGPWAAYPGTGATSNTTAIILSGSVSIGSGQVKGNLKLGAGVATPPVADYTGTVTTGYSAKFPLPIYPTAGSVSQSYNLAASIPSTLPRGGDLPAADGRYYYFCSGATISTTSITAGKNVTITGTTTKLNTGLVVPATSTCFIYMDGVVSVSGATALRNSSWAGAVRIYTSTSSACSVGNNTSIMAWIYAPNAALSFGNSGTTIGSYLAKTITAGNGQQIHYDAAVRQSSSAGPWDVGSWYAMQSSADRSTVGALTGNFLP